MGTAYLLRFSLPRQRLIPIGVLFVNPKAIRWGNLWETMERSETCTWRHPYGGELRSLSLGFCWTPTASTHCQAREWAIWEVNPLVVILLARSWHWVGQKWAFLPEPCPNSRFRLIKDCCYFKPRSSGVVCYEEYLTGTCSTKDSWY